MPSDVRDVEAVSTDVNAVCAVLKTGDDFWDPKIPSAILAHITPLLHRLNYQKESKTFIELI